MQSHIVRLSNGKPVLFAIVEEPDGKHSVVSQAEPGPLLDYLSRATERVRLQAFTQAITRAAEGPRVEPIPTMPEELR